MSNTSFINEIKKMGSVLSEDVIHEYLTNLTKLYLSLLTKYSADINGLGHLSSKWDYHLFTIIKSLHERFFSMIEGLSTVYDRNFYYEVYQTIKEEGIKKDKNKTLMLNVMLTLISKNHEYVIERIENTRSPREKLFVLEEFNIIKLFLQRPCHSIKVPSGYLD